MESDYLFVDSRSRDVGLYPSGNSYVIDLVDPLKNISRVDLVCATVPNTMYNWYDTIIPFLTLGGTDVYLRPGFYGACSIISALTAAITDLSIVFGESDGRFTISKKAAFTLSITSPRALTLMGFSNNPFTSGGAVSFRSDGICDFLMNEFVFLDVEELRSARMNTTPNTTANHAFGAIPMNVCSGSIKVFEEQSDYRLRIAYSQPIEKISRLTINWRDLHGKLVDFNGANNNSFMVRITRTLKPRELAPLPVYTPPVVIVRPKRRVNKSLLICLAIAIAAFIYSRRESLHTLAPVAR